MSRSIPPALLACATLMTACAAHGPILADAPRIQMPQAAQTPCVDACARRATCGTSDPKCLELCRVRTQQLPGDGYRAARCVVEAKTCADVAACN